MCVRRASRVQRCVKNEGIQLWRSQDHSQGPWDKSLTKVIHLSHQVDRFSAVKDLRAHLTFLSLQFRIKHFWRIDLITTVKD